MEFAMSTHVKVEKLCNWIINSSLPLWSTEGINHSEGNFYERLSFSGEPLTNIPHRAMVQARQIYVFSHASINGFYPQGGNLALTAAYRMIKNYYETDGSPGWIFSINAENHIIDNKRDLYTHAFVLFGLAWAYRLNHDKIFLDTALSTIKFVDRHFSAPYGGYFSTAVSVQPSIQNLCQNPHMHLFEAMLAWYEATEKENFISRCDEIYDLMASRLFQASKGALPEYFNIKWTPQAGEVGRICEPGHHYEWSWLLRKYAEKVGKDHEPISMALKLFADKYGYDTTGLVIDEVLDDGSVFKPSRRSWPQTEAIKAEVAAFEYEKEAAAQDRAACIIDKLYDNFLNKPIHGGWIDHINSEGDPLVDYMPASTLYHVFLASAEIHRVWGR